MESLAWLAAIPLLVMGWHLAGMGLGQLARRKALRELPEAVRGLGGGDSHGGAPGRFATYELDYRGRRVTIAPETRGFVMARTSAEVPWRLSTLKDPVRKHGMEYFETGDSEFDSLFKARYAAPEVAETLRSDAAVRKQLLAAASPKKLAAKWVQLDEQGVSMSAREAHKLGAPSYMRAEGLAERLDAVNDLAARVDASFTSRYPADS